MLSVGKGIPMKELDAKTLRRLRREEKLADMAEGRKERAETFRSPRDYRRKSKYPTDYLEVE
jgi:hypothetical protein